CGAGGPRVPAPPRPAERASTQGLAAPFMGLMGAFGSAAGGMILGVWGFTVLNTLGAALVLGPLGATLLRRPVFSRTSQAAEKGASASLDPSDARSTCSWYASPSDFGRVRASRPS